MRGHLVVGANLGDREQQIAEALEMLPAHGVTITASSSLYESAPVGPVADQPPYLNVAAAFETQLEPLALLDALKAIERELGRETDTAAPGYVDQGPRPIDLDIALLEGVALDSGRLTVPHPRLLERRFALIPLLELDFTLQTPEGRRLSDALAEMMPTDQPVRRFARGAASGP